MNLMNNENYITTFRGEYAFLSNFYEADVHYWGLKFRNNEAAFQAMKNPSQAKLFTGIDAATAKRLGRKVMLRHDWEQIKENVMYSICLAKFTQNPELGERLLATGDRMLIEGNTWGDTVWGVCNGIGKNLLGNILMRVRSEIKRNN